MTKDVQPRCWCGHKRIYHRYELQCRAPAHAHSNGQVCNLYEPQRKAAPVPEDGTGGAE